MTRRWNGDRSIIETALDRLIIAQQHVTGDPVPLEKAMQRSGVAGLAVAVIRDSRIVADLAVGSCPTTGRPIEADTLFQVGSTSKLVTALGALVLTDQDGLALDTDVQDVLTSWRLPQGAHTPEHPVTLARLLSHTAGINVHGFLGYGPDDDRPDLAGVLDGRGNSDSVRVTVTPGTEFEYSGGGYCIIEQVMVDATGASFAELMDDLVLGPAGCTQAGFHQPLSNQLATRATAGAINHMTMAERWRIHPELAAAGLWASVRDLARIFVAAGRSVAGDPNAIAPLSGPRLVSPPMVVGSTVPDHGLGAALDNGVSPTRFSHSGRNLGYCSDNVMSMDGRDGVVVLTNGFPGGRPVARALIDAITQR